MEGSSLLLVTNKSLKSADKFPFRAPFEPRVLLCDKDIERIATRAITYKAEKCGLVFKEKWQLGPALSPHTQDLRFTKQSGTGVPV